jgi:FAD/FMN-containing dehydrogenase
VSGHVVPSSLEAVRQAILSAARDGRAISVAGGRHAMGGQQFGSDTLLIDVTAFDRVLGFDSERGLVEVESGVQWPKLIRHLIDAQRGHEQQWGIAQKQTGTDRLTIGGALAANAHGRGLHMKPMISDVEAFTLVDADGEVRTCSRTENPDLFRLAIGGYGLFGVIATVKLRLAQRRKVERVVELVDVDRLPEYFEERKASGFIYGDCQYAIDESTPDYIRKGVLSCYRPVPNTTPIPEGQRRLSASNWKQLIYLAHVDKRRAFEQYARYYMSTSGQVYWSDLHQLSSYLDDYHRPLDRRMQATHEATEVISEVYVPLPSLGNFLGEVREDFRREAINVIYGTIRLIEMDDESFLPWAKQRYACVIFNLHTKHTTAGIEKSARAFRALIDTAIRRGGSYFLTYHRFARRDQVVACYPRFVEFLRLKEKYDPGDRWQSEWYRHYRRLFADRLL